MTRIALIFDKTRPDTTGIYFERAGRALGLSVDHWWLRDAARIPTDYALYVRVDQGDDYSVQLPASLRPAVLYAIDTHLPYSFRKIRRLASQFDLVFCCHREAVGCLRNAVWLPVACDSTLHRREDDVPRTLDVAFVGTSGGVPRKFYLQALRERYLNHFIGAADYTQLGVIYSQARIGFNYAIAGDVNMRVFEVLAAGALLVTNALPHDDLARLSLIEGEHLVLYRRPKELFERIDFFLAHAEERRRIAQAGQALALERHTYAHRLRQLLTMVSERCGVALPDGIRETTSCLFA